MAAAQQLHQPWPARAVPLGVADDRHGADEQHPAQISVAGLGGPAEPLLAARRPDEAHRRTGDRLTDRLGIRGIVAPSPLPPLHILRRPPPHLMAKRDPPPPPIVGRPDKT